MNPYKTVNILMNTYIAVWEMFWEIHYPDTIPALIPLTMVRREVTPSPDTTVYAAGAVTEAEYEVLEGNTIRAVVNVDFYDGALANFNILVYANEWFGKRAVRYAVDGCLIPYVAEHSSSPVWEPYPFGLINRDQGSGLLHQVRIPSDRPAGTGASITDARYAGM
jgi:hypothetical protein